MKRRRDGSFGAVRRTKGVEGSKASGLRRACGEIETHRGLRLIRGSPPSPNLANSPRCTLSHARLKSPLALHPPH